MSNLCKNYDQDWWSVLRALTMVERKKNGWESIALLLIDCPLISFNQSHRRAEGRHLFSTQRWFDKWEHLGKIHFVIYTNTFCILDKYIQQTRQIHSALHTSSDGTRLMGGSNSGAFSVASYCQRCLRRCCIALPSGPCVIIPNVTYDLWFISQMFIYVFPWFSKPYFSVSANYIS